MHQPFLVINLRGDLNDFDIKLLILLFDWPSGCEYHQRRSSALIDMTYKLVSKATVAASLLPKLQV